VDAVSDDRLGALGFLVVAAPVLAGEDEALRDAIGQLEAGAGSPFGDIGGVHFARLVVLEDLPAAGDRLLWWSTTFDGTRERFLAAAAEHAGAALDVVLRHCVGWPGVRDAAALMRWVEARRLPAQYVLAAQPDATLPQIRVALRRQRALGALAARARDLDPAALRAAFTAEVVGA
jgi:hypothetical protein